MQTITMTSRPLAAKAPCAAAKPAARQLGAVRPAKPAARVVAAAAKEFDFDALLMEAANKFEKADNKAAIVGYGSAAFGAIIFAEYLIHLPLFNVLLGFPIQLLGLLLLPYLGIKYVVDGDDYKADAEAVLKKVTDQLPGLGK